MNLKDRFTEFFNFDKKKPQSASVTKYITLEQQLQRVRADAEKFKIALQAAESTMYPIGFYCARSINKLYSMLKLRLVCFRENQRYFHRNSMY